MSETDVLSRLDAVAEAIAALDQILDSEAALDEELGQVARNAVAAVVGADAVSITVLGDAQSFTAAYTDDFVLALDAEQYSAGRGPCLAAAQTGQPVRLTMASTEQEWPEFAAAARASGVQATLSIPLVVDSAATNGTTELVGSVNVYSRSTPQFGPIDEKVLSLYTSLASRAIATNRQWRQLRNKVAQLSEALVSRTDIDQAKGALRVLNGGSADEAFAVLVERSQRENVKIRELARQVLDDLSRGVPPRGLRLRRWDGDRGAPLLLNAGLPSHVA